MRVDPYTALLQCLESVSLHAALDGALPVFTHPFIQVLHTGSGSKDQKCSYLPDRFCVRWRCGKVMDRCRLQRLPLPVLLHFHSSLPLVTHSRNHQILLDMHVLLSSLSRLDSLRPRTGISMFARKLFGSLYSFVRRSRVIRVKSCLRGF